MIWLYVIALAAAVAILVAFVSRPISFTLSLIQILSFIALAFGLIGWFIILADPRFIWYIAVGGGIWVMTTALRSNLAA